MKPFRILKTFNGSQTGIDTDTFEAGTVRDISAHLADAVRGTGWIEPFVESTPVKEPDAPEALVNAVEYRETKVVEPEETKPTKPFAKKGKK